jgi:hypothetical protein
MAINDTTRRINILEPLSRLIKAMEMSIQAQLSEYIDGEGRLIVEDENEYTYVSLYWDRIDEALFVDVEKSEVPGKGWDETNTYDDKTHRIYPSFVAGAPTVAAQFEIQKLGYVTTELPVGNSMTATFSSLSTIELEFTNDIIAASVTSRTLNVRALPFGEILSLTSSTAGVGYLSSGVSINQFISAQYTLSNLSGSGSDAIVIVTANPTSVPLGDPSALTISSGGARYFTTSYMTYFQDEISNARASGLEVFITVDGNGSVIGVDVIEGGIGYIKGDVVAIYGDPNPDFLATFTINTVSGGEITSVELSFGGINYVAGDVSTVEPVGWVDEGRSLVEDSTVTVTTAVESSNSTDFISVLGVSASEPKTKTVTVSLSTSATYSTTYRVRSTSLNLAKERVGTSALATTEAATLPCPAITSILFEAYGSGSQSILPRTLVEYNATHSNTQFLYYGTEGISWANFIAQTEFTGANPPIEVPESITHPDTVYAYYRDGAYLLPDSSWIVGIIGSETDYEGNYEYVLYTLDNILNYKQLTTAGSSTAPCGTSDWGGDWGASIQQFAIRR